MDKKKISLKEIGLPKLVLIFTAGILLILLSVPGAFFKGSKENRKSTVNHIVQENEGNMTSQDANTYVTELEQKLKSILKKVNGIGDVEVMITLKGSSEQITLKDSPYTQEGLNEIDGEGGSRTNNSIKREESTVLVINEDGKTVPYIIKELEPEVDGVLVVAEGGDDARVMKDIMEAAEVLFSIPVHKVKVMKMNN